jgi:lipopolysaccharide export LptBFGC system permease protein LptF
METMTPTFVTEFIFVVVETLVKNQCKGKILKLFLLACLIIFFQFVKFCFIFMLLQGLLETWLQVWLSRVVLLLCNVDALAMWM